MLPKLRNGTTGNGTLKITAASGNEVTLVIDQGIIGPQGPMGEGVPLGGVTGQVLVKASDANYDTTWVSLSGMSYKGTWNAATNTPTLTSGVGVAGGYYIVNVPGNTNLDGITDWKINDWAVFNGTVWQKIDNTDSVTSVNGKTGAVTLVASDVGAPSTSGTGATGTWGIDISGNAATATNADSAVNVSGVVAIANGGTGSTNTIDARTALGVPSTAGVGATGTWGVSITGTANKATNIAGGATNQIPVQAGLTDTTFIGAPTASGQVLGYNGTAIGWVAGGGGSTLAGVTQATTPFLTALGGAANTTTTGLNNTLIGTNAGKLLTTGPNNTAVGTDALATATTAAYNTCIGDGAGQLLTGSSNTIVGQDALKGASGGSQNTVIGCQAGEVLTGSGNVIIGYQTGDLIGNVSNSVCIGQQAGGAWTTGTSGTVALGYAALNALTTGTNNVALGTSAGQNNQTGANNTFVGNNSGQNATGSNSTFVGYQSGLATTGSGNTFIGSAAGDAATTLADAVAIGKNAIGAVATSAAAGAVAIGVNSLLSLTTGAGNTAIGFNAGQALTTGGQNTYIGYQAGLTDSTGISNTCVGYGAGKLLTGNTNTIIGTNAGAALTSSTQNTFVGYGAGSNITSTGGNTCIGPYAGYAGMTNSCSLSDGGSIVRLFINNNGAVAFTSAFDFGGVNQVLYSQGNVNPPIWRNANLSNSISLTNNYNISSTYSTYFIEPAVTSVTLTLPAPSSSTGLTFTIKRTDTMDVGKSVILTTPSGTIDNAANLSIAIKCAYTVTSDGSNWYIVSNYIPPVALAAPTLLSTMGGNNVAIVNFEPVEGATDYVAEATEK